MKGSKKILSLFVASVIMFTSLRLTEITAADSFFSGSYTYTVGEKNEATITAYNGNSYYVDVPEEIDGYKVTAIGLYAFEEKSVRSVTLPDTVVSIGYGAFRDCKFLSQIEMSGGITAIDGSAFSGCTSLTDITIPDSVTTIGDGAFERCTYLKNVKLSKNLAYLGGGAFGETAIESIEIPKSLDECGAWFKYDCEINGTTYSSISCGPFCFCDSLKNVAFETGVTKIPRYLFAGCTGLEEITVPDTVTVIECEAFNDCLSLKSAAIGNAVTEIQDSVFGWCISLTDITIPDSVTTIGENAFDNCISLKSVKLSKNLAHLGGGAFGATAIESIEIPKSLDECGAWFKYDCEINGTTYSSISCGPFCFCDSLKNVAFETGVTKIPRYLFAGCTGLEEITVPDTVTVIEYEAFNDCLGLKSAAIGNAVTEIQDSAFGWCISLTDITIPDSVTSIGHSVFNQCTSLPKVTLPDSVASVGESVFENCTSLESINLPNAISLITMSMFQGCSALKTVELPSSVSEIDVSAFESCTALESVTFKDGKASLATIGYSAFRGCTALKEAPLPETVVEIDGNAFENCTSLIRAYIPRSKMTIGSGAFKGCSSLSDLKFSDYSIAAVKSDTFMDCRGLEEVILPKGLAAIDSQAFRNDTSLTSVTIPESVISIDGTAFSYPERTTVYGVAGSYAEVFAGEGGFKFNGVGIEAEGIAPSNGVESIILDVGEMYRAEFECYPENTTDIITLTSSSNSVTVNMHNIYAEYSGNAVVTACASSGVTCELYVHVRGVEKISVTTTADKPTYMLGEEIDRTGFSVWVIYDDGSFREITDYVISGFDSSAEGVCPVTVSWTTANGYTYETILEVLIVDPSPKLTGIYIKTLPEKREYGLRETLDLTGMTVEGTYTDGSVKVIPLSEYTVNGYNALKNGIQTITVSCGGFSDTFTVAVGQGFDECIHTNTTHYDAVASTCRIHGHAAYTVCDECGEVIEGSDAELPLSDHTGGEATCNKRAVCAACGEEYGQSDSLNHAGGIEVRNSVSASCGADGYTGDTYCKGCGQKIMTGAVISATGEHNYIEKASIEYLKSPASSDRKAVYYKSCSVCGKKSSETFEYGEKLPEDGSARIAVESKTVLKGTEFTVSVVIENNPGFAYLELTPTYSDSLTLVGVKNGGLIGDLTQGKQYVWVADNDVYGAGTLMTFTFTTADSIGAGSYEVGFVLRSCVNYDEQNVNISIVNGTVEVVDFTYGDANGDRAVNGQDVVRIKKYLANYDYETQTSAVGINAGADANGDGSINGQDVVRLKKYLANYDYETNTSTIVLGPQN